MATLPVVYRTPAEVKALWVAALRSSKYKQGTNRLREGDEFCCLGVLCDLAAKDGGDHWRGLPSNPHYARHQWVMRAPHQLFNYVGLPPNVTQNKLMVMNDSGASFSQIADFIEQAS